MILWQHRLNNGIRHTNTRVDVSTGIISFTSGCSSEGNMHPFRTDWGLILTLSVHAKHKLYFFIIKEPRSLERFQRWVYPSILINRTQIGLCQKFIVTSVLIVGNLTSFRQIVPHTLCKWQLWCNNLIWPSFMQAVPLCTDYAQVGTSYLFSNIMQLISYFR